LIKLLIHVNIPRFILMRNNTKHMFKLDIESLEQICGNSKEVIIFGLNYKHNEEIGCSISQAGIGIRTFKYDILPFKRINYEYDSSKGLKRICKNAITSLVFENYKRVKENQPIIPLLFCIAYENEDKLITLDSEKAATSHSNLMDNVSDAEIRRIYKTISEMNPEIINIALLTFKFIQQVKVDDNFYKLAGKFFLEEKKNE